MLVLRPGRQPEQGRLEREALGLTRLEPLVHGLERVANGDRSVGEDLAEDRLGARDQAGGRDDLVHEADAIRLLGADDSSGEDELKGPALPDEPRQALRAAATRNDSELYLGLAELRGLRGDPDRAGHRRLAA